MKQAPGCRLVNEFNAENPQKMICPRSNLVLCDFIPFNQLGQQPNGEGGLICVLFFFFLLIRFSQCLTDTINDSHV